MMDTSNHDVLDAPDTGHKVIRGSTIRGAGYVVGMALTAIASIFLLRHLGVVNFGRFVTVTSLISIVTALADAGLTAIGQREYVLRDGEAERRHLLASLLGLRLLIAPAGALVAVAFALLAGYPRVMVTGTALAGIGMVVYMAQVTLAMPLSVQLRLTALTATEVLRQSVMVGCFGLLVMAGASLLPFLAVQIPAAAVALVATMILARRTAQLRPAFDREQWRSLLVESLPVAAALAVNVVYFRMLIIMMSLLVVGVETGLFATSFRILEILIGIPVLMLSTALPVLSHAGRENLARLRYVMQRMTEVALIAACFLILVILITAGPVIEILGGSPYSGAAPVLRIQALALLGAFMGQAWQLGLISIHRQSALIVTNAAALVTVVALGFILIPPLGAQGAAIAAAIGEVTLATATLVMLVRADRDLMPSFAFSRKVVLATALAALPMLVPSVPAFATAAVASAVYIVVVLSTKVLPPETLRAFMRRSTAVENTASPL